MKYNKIALFLILLASSAFASFSGKSDQDLQKLATNIKADLNTEWTKDNGFNSSKTKKIITQEYLDSIDFEGKFGLKEFEKKCLIGKDFKTLKKGGTDFILETLSSIRSAAAAAELIFDKCGADGVSSIELAQYDSKLTDEQYAKIKNFEQNSGGLPLQKDEIEDFLLNGNLPKPLSPVDKILKVANGDKVSSKELKAYGCDLIEAQYEVIKTKETDSNSRIDKDLLESILKLSNDELEELAKPVAVPSPSPSPAPAPVPAPSPPASPKTLTQDEIAAEILKYVKDGKINTAHKAELESLKLTTGQVDKLLAETELDADKIDEILKSSDAPTSPAPPSPAPPSPAPPSPAPPSPAPSPAPPAPSPAPPAPSPAPAPPAPKILTNDEIAANIVKLYVKDGKIDKSHKDALLALKLTTGQVDKLLAETGLDATKIKAILNAPDAPPAATPKPLTEAEIAKEIFGKYVKDGKINSDDVSKKAIMALGITSAQFDKLVAIDKIDSVTKIEENLKATAPAPASANTKINIDFAAILKIAAANAGKIVEANRDALKLLGLSAAQIDLLLTASGLDSVDKIEKLLITGTEPSNNEKPKTTEIKAEAAEKGDGANGPWYTSGWVLGISGILIISAIGGGAYIITRKSNETDL
jgi:hypothetical protein